MRAADQLSQFRRDAPLSAPLAPVRLSTYRHNRDAGTRARRCFDHASEKVTTRRPVHRKGVHITVSLYLTGIPRLTSGTRPPLRREASYAFLFSCPKHR